MKKLALWAAMTALCIATVAEARSVRVKGYFRKDGTYVAPHVRSAPNSSKLDNYSTKGNVNPYTGKTGTVEPWRWPGTPVVAPIYTSPANSGYAIKTTPPPTPAAPLYSADPIVSYAAPETTPPAGKGIAIFGSGPTINCGDWIASTESETHVRGLDWLMGFYSAASLYGTTSDDFTGGKGANSLYSATMAYCKLRPSETLNYAGDYIMNLFAPTQADTTP